MSDTEARKVGYRIEYASSGRAKCKGPKPCGGTTLDKGVLRFGSLVDFQGKTSYAWRHWECVTKKILENAKKQLGEADELDGYEELTTEDKERVKQAWEAGEVALDGMPEGMDDDAEDKPKKRAAPKKKKNADEDGEEKPKKRGRKPKKTEEDDDDVEATEKPKKTRARKPKKAVEDDEDDDEKPKKIRKKPESKAKTAPKKRVSKKKADDDGSGEDLGNEVDKIAEDEEAEAEDSSGLKRKRPTSKASKPPSRASKRTKASSSKGKEVVEDEEDED